MSKTNKAAILHLIIILFIYSTPFWLNWKYILLGGLINLMQIWIFKGYILSRYQFKNTSQGFYIHYIDKLFPKNSINIYYLNIFLDYFIPIFFALCAYLIQS
jgi:hypothetical protein